jgi:hypothetical protein
VNTPSFHAEFKDYKEFNQKQVARRILFHLDAEAAELSAFAHLSKPQTGGQIEAQVTDLSELRQSEDSLFSMPQATPQKEHLQTLRIAEADARKMLLNSPEIKWDSVHEGKTSGVLSLMIYTDREGHVRETRPLNSENQFVLEQARKEILKWRFEPLQRDGGPAQMETLLTLPFQTSISDPLPLLTDAQARKLATYKVEPMKFGPKTAKPSDFTVRITVNERGEVVGFENVYKADTQLYNVATAILRMWRFKPYKVDGKAQRFNADITFHL